MRTHLEHQAAAAALLAPLIERLADPAVAEVIRVGDALGRILSTDIASPTSLPRFANSQMDGYAVRAADLASASPDSPVRMEVGRTSAAGDPVGTMDAGTGRPRS